MDELVKALRAGEQADMDGTLVKVSRQACEEAADAIEALQAENARLRKLDVEYGRVETAIIMADPHFDGDSDHANCADRLIASVQRLASTARDKALGDADYFGSLVANARVSAAKAAKKFPQPNYVALKIAEEAGEVVRGAVHYAEGRMDWLEVEGEIIQLIAMLIRFVNEGDQVNGITPPSAP